MLGGFKFCGVNIGDFNLEYVPAASDTFVFQGSDYDISEQSIDAHDGGYYYGASVKPKTFKLRCMFEETDINEGLLSTIENFFYRGRTGKLVFEKRDWIWYSATVIGVDFSGILNYRNGLISITMRAYYPYGRHDELYLKEQYGNYGNIVRNSALLQKEATPDISLASNDVPLTSETSFLLYNGGTEKASVAIEIAGDAVDGVVIENRTNGTSCKFIAMTKALTSDFDKYIVCDAMNGKTILTNGKTSELCFLCHDRGFIELDPAYPIVRDAQIQYFYNSIGITSNCVFNENHVGKYIMLENKWRKIVSVMSDSLAYLEQPMSKPGLEYTNIVSMNEMYVSPVSSMALTKLNFVYKPTFK